jgi:hypothetical protein
MIAEALHVRRTRNLEGTREVAVQASALSRRQVRDDGFAHPIVKRLDQRLGARRMGSHEVGESQTRERALAVADLARAFERCEAALQARPERDADPVIEALGYVLWLAVLGDRGAYRKYVSPLLRLARRTELALSAAAMRHDLEPADEAELIAASLRGMVRAARAVLEGEDVRAAAASTSPIKLHPPAGVLVRLLDGHVDGLTAGRYALHAANCDRCRDELAVLGFATAESQAPAIWRAAATATARVRSPSEGTVVARKRRPAIEAVLFRDADASRLAIYAANPTPVRFVAEGATTEESLLGYWMCRIDDARDSLVGKLYVGDAITRFEVALRRRSKKSPVAQRSRARRTRKPKARKA